MYRLVEIKFMHLVKGIVNYMYRITQIVNLPSTWRKIPILVAAFS